MNCFMGYNPLVAKEVKITTWIKEFDGDSPVYPSFPNDGDCFVVFATDEDALTHNALSKKTYTNGEWADAEGGGGGFDYPTFTLDIQTETFTCDKTFAECLAMCTNDVADGQWFAVQSEEEDGETYNNICIMIDQTVIGEDFVQVITRFNGSSFYYHSDGTITSDFD